MKKELSQEDRQAYVQSGGARCPYCESERIEGAVIVSEELTLIERVDCEACGRHWYDRLAVRELLTAEEWEVYDGAE